MKMLKNKSVLIVVVMLLLAILTACQTVQADAPADAVAQEDPPSLTTASVVARLSNQPTRAIVSARGNSFIIDSIPPLGGSNEELNPMDILLGSVATCAAFVYEGAAKEMDFFDDLGGITATAEGDFDVRGLLGEEGVNPRVQVFRVHMDVPGATDDQLLTLEEEYKARCPIYTTFSRSADIELTTNDEQPSAPTEGEGMKTASAVAQVSNQQPGRAIVSSRGNHYIVDSVPPLGGPNEMRNPMDLALGALATCATIIYEDEAKERGLPLTGLTATVEADFDARGMFPDSKEFNPRIQAFRVTMELEGPNRGQANKLEKAAKDIEQDYVKRCPVYNTFIRSAPIEIETVTISK